MAFQDLFNTAMGALMLLAGWFLRVVWDSVKQLQAEDRRKANKLVDLD